MNAFVLMQQRPLWVSDDAIAKWLNSDHTCEKGRPRIYSDDAILCALMVREIFHLPLQALEGFLNLSAN